MLDYILPHCSRTHIENMLSELTTRQLWLSVDKALERVESLSQCNSQDKDNLLMRELGEMRWDLVGRLLKAGGYNDEQLTKTLRQACSTERAPRDMQSIQKNVLPHYTAVLLLGIAEKCAVEDDWESIDRFLEVTISNEQSASVLSGVCKVYAYATAMTRIQTQLGVARLHFLTGLLASRSLQLPPDAHSVALGFALHQGRWDVVRQANLQLAWEQVRRELFRAAVEQRRWSVVKRWADLTLYLDQRWWALQEAYKHKQ
jgi:hypothetical protein